jgi:hypothetical protein
MNAEHKEDLVSRFGDLREVAVTARSARRSNAPDCGAWPRARGVSHVLVATGKRCDGAARLVAEAPRRRECQGECTSLPPSTPIFSRARFLPNPAAN